MDDIEGKILLFIEHEYDTDTILRELNIEEENLADTIIELESNGLVTVENKNWVLTQKGKDILKERKELLKKLKIGYLRGNIDKDEFQKKREELESFMEIEKSIADNKIDKTLVDKEDSDLGIKEDRKKVCPKCKKDNKVGSKYCAKCGEPLS